MMWVVRRARCRSFSVRLLNASVTIRLITSGMFRGRGALEGKRFTTNMVLFGSSFLCSAPMTLESGVLSNKPPSQYGISGSPLAGEGALVIGKLGGRLP